MTPSIPGLEARCLRAARIGPSTLASGHRAILNGLRLELGLTTLRPQARDDSSLETPVYRPTEEMGLAWREMAQATSNGELTSGARQMLQRATSRLREVLN